MQSKYLLYYMISNRSTIDDKVLMEDQAWRYVSIKDLSSILCIIQMWQTKHAYMGFQHPALMSWDHN